MRTSITTMSISITAPHFTMAATRERRISVCMQERNSTPAPIPARSAASITAASRGGTRTAGDRASAEASMREDRPVAGSMAVAASPAADHTAAEGTGDGTVHENSNRCIRPVRAAPCGLRCSAPRRAAGREDFLHARRSKSRALPGRPGQGRVNQDDVVYAKDLGPRTGPMAKGMARYEPDSTWHPDE